MSQALQWQVYPFALSKTWVRTPGLYNSIYYFAMAIPMQAQRYGSPYAFIIRPSTYLTNSNQRLRLDVYHKPGQRINTLVEKVNGPRLNGPAF